MTHVATFALPSSTTMSSLLINVAGEFDKMYLVSVSNVKIRRLSMPASRTSPSFAPFYTLDLTIVGIGIVVKSFECMDVACYFRH